MPSEEESKKPNYYSPLLLIARKILVFHQKVGWFYHQKLQFPFLQGLSEPKLISKTRIHPTRQMPKTMPKHVHSLLPCGCSLSCIALAWPTPFWYRAFEECAPLVVVFRQIFPSLDEVCKIYKDCSAGAGRVVIWTLLHEDRRIQRRKPTVDHSSICCLVRKTLPVG